METLKSIQIEVVQAIVRDVNYHNQESVLDYNKFIEDSYILNLPNIIKEDWVLNLETTGLISIVGDKFNKKIVLNDGFYEATQLEFYDEFDIVAERYGYKKVSKSRYFNGKKAFDWNGLSFLPVNRGYSIVKSIACIAKCHAGYSGYLKAFKELEESENFYLKKSN